MKVISIINTKGGCSKTVTAIHLGASLAKMGNRVLLLDVDKQHGLTTYFSIGSNHPTMVDVIRGGALFEEMLIQVKENLWVVPSSAKMLDAESELGASGGGEVRLRHVFRRFKAEAETLPDYIILDCHGGWSIIERNALLASDSFIVPINSEPPAVHTALQTIGAVRELEEYHERKIPLLGVLLTRTRHTRTATAVCESVRKQWGSDVFEASIRQAEKINELSILGETTGDGASSHPVHHDHEELALEVIRRGE